jgi:hypothetical protein
MLKEIEYPSYPDAVQRVSWGAVFAGAVTSLAVMLSLVSLGTGIGLIAAPAADNAANAARGLGIGGGIGMLLCGIVSYYIGGWVAGRLTGIARVSESVLHGFVSWGTATVMFAFLFTTAAVGAFGAASGAIGNAVGMRSARGGGPIGTGVADEVTATDTARASRAAGAAGLFGFLMLACDAAASCYGARNGTRLLKPVTGPQTRVREHAGL